MFVKFSFLIALTATVMSFATENLPKDHSYPKLEIEFQGPYFEGVYEAQLDFARGYDVGDQGPKYEDYFVYRDRRTLSAAERGAGRVLWPAREMTYFPKNRGTSPVIDDEHNCSICLQLKVTRDGFHYDEDFCVSLPYRTMLQALSDQQMILDERTCVPGDIRKALPSLNGTAKISYCTTVLSYDRALATLHVRFMARQFIPGFLQVDTATP